MSGMYDEAGILHGCGNWKRLIKETGMIKYAAEGISYRTGENGTPMKRITMYMYSWTGTTLTRRHVRMFSVSAHLGPERSSLEQWSV
jgi:hypothetical protein